MNGAVLLVFTLFWSGMVLMFDGFMTRDVYWQYESAHFQSVDGIITHSRITVSHSSKGGTSYHASIQYVFTAGGQEYSGSKVRYGLNVSNRETAQAEVNAHPVGSHTQVYYDPADPHIALLSPGIEGWDFVGFLFLTPFNLMMLGFWVQVGGWLRERLFEPAAGGVRIITDGLNTRLRLPQWPSVYWGLIAAGIFDGIALLVIALATGMDPSIPAILWTIAAVYAGGAGVYLWRCWKINLGIDDLIINEPARTMELPLTFGRKERLTVKLADVERLEVETIAHRGKSTTYTYAPTLYLRRGDAQKLADWQDQMKADEFTNWLRSHLGFKSP